MCHHALQYSPVGIHSCSELLGGLDDYTVPQKEGINNTYYTFKLTPPGTSIECGRSICSHNTLDPILMLVTGLVTFFCEMASHSSTRSCWRSAWAGHSILSTPKFWGYSVMILALWGRVLSSWKMDLGPRSWRYWVTTASRISFW